MEEDEQRGERSDDGMECETSKEPSEASLVQSHSSVGSHAAAPMASADALTPATDQLLVASSMQHLLTAAALQQVDETGEDVSSHAAESVASSQDMGHATNGLEDTSGEIVGNGIDLLDGHIPGQTIYVDTTGQQFVISEDGQAIPVELVNGMEVAADGMVDPQTLQIAGIEGNVIAEPIDHIPSDADGSNQAQDRLQPMEILPAAVNNNSGKPEDEGVNSEIPQPHLILSADAIAHCNRAVSAKTNQNTLQSLLSSGGAQVTTPKGQKVQIITMSPAQGLFQSGKLWQVVAADDAPNASTKTMSPPKSSGISALLAASDSAQQEQAENSEKELMKVASQVVDITDGNLNLLMPPPPPPSGSTQEGVPSWAQRLKDCEKIGNAFRGWVENDIQLDILLTFHKQQTQSFWGTRQSPSPAKPSTRLMWKSQYVPFDGIPFVNAGSRAIVMECQFGPRRKGAPKKKKVPTATLR